MYAYYRNGFIILVSKIDSIPKEHQYIEVPEDQLPIEPGYDYKIDFENRRLIKAKIPMPSPIPTPEPSPEPSTDTKTDDIEIWKQLAQAIKEGVNEV